MHVHRRKLISFVVPVHNEEGNIRRLYQEVENVMRPLADRYEWEYVFTDNRSDDRSFEILSDMARKDPSIHVIRFSRDFGYQRSILTGYQHARGDAAVQLDCDLQDPPSLIPEFLARWEEGYQVVYGVRRHRKEGWTITQARKAFYRLLNFLSEDHLPNDAGDFRLVDCKILNELQRIRDESPYLRGAIATMGFRQCGVSYDREARTDGQSKFSLRHLVGLAVDGILSHSILPLRLATLVGGLLFVVNLVMLVGYTTASLTVGKDWPSGFTTLVVLILFSLSLNAFFFGIVGEYLGRVYRQLKRHSLTIVDEELNPVCRLSSVARSKCDGCPSSGRDKHDVEIVTGVPAAGATRRDEAA